MITIEKAKPEYIPEIIRLIKEFFEESLNYYSLSLDETTIYETVTNYINNLVVSVAKKDGIVIGVIGGVIIPSIFDKNQLIGQETIWYVTKSERKGRTGILLIENFEKRCKELGANLISMVHMGNLQAKVLNRFYLSRGYKKMEIQYLKEV